MKFLFDIYMVPHKAKMQILNHIHKVKKTTRITVYDLNIDIYQKGKSEDATENVVNLNCPNYWQTRQYAMYTRCIFIDKKEENISPLF